MKKLKIATIVFLAGTAVCLCALLVLLLSGEGRWSGTGGNGDGSGIFGSDTVAGDYALVLEKEIAPENISSLKVDYGMTFNDVYFYPSEGESVVIREYMNFTPDENQISKVEEKDGTLQIKGVKRTHFSFFSFHAWNAYTEIYLPVEFAGRLEDVYVKTVSGDIISEISFALQKTFSASSTSGDIRIPEAGADKVQISSTSGYVRIGSAYGEQVSVSTTSGDIALERTVGGLKISSTSGNAILDWVQGDVSASTTSGNVTLDQVEGDISASTSSGNAILDWVQGDVTVSTTSGDITLGEVEGDMDISSTSGIIRLREGRGRFDGDAISGDIRLEMLDGAFQVNTTSGDVSIAGGSGCGEAETISGDIQISLSSLMGDIEVSTTSGSVGFQFPETASFTLGFDSTSGGCRTFFDEQLMFNKKGNQAKGQYGSGEHTVYVSTISGDLRITKE